MDSLKFLAQTENNLFSVLIAVVGVVSAIIAILSMLVKSSVNQIKEDRANYRQVIGEFQEYLKQENLNRKEIAGKQAVALDNLSKEMSKLSTESAKQTKILENIHSGQSEVVKLVKTGTSNAI